MHASPAEPARPAQPAATAPARCGCIDIGSNTTRLLVAEATAGADGEGALRELVTERAFTRIGASRAADKRIPAATIERVAEVAAGQLRTAHALGAEEVVAVATAAIRDAPNRDELAAAVARAAGLELRVLSGEAEARLGFLGATRALGERAARGGAAATGGRSEGGADPDAGPDPDSGAGPDSDSGAGPDSDLGPDTVAVADVGGGSTELAVGSPAGEVAWWASLPVGSSVLAGAHLRSDPPAAAELDRARASVAEAFAGLDPPPVASAVAVGGTATSLHRLVGPELTATTLAHGLELLCASPAALAAQRLGLDPERVRLLPAGMVVLEAVCARLRRALCVVGGGLREGVLLERLAGHPLGDR